MTETDTDKLDDRMIVAKNCHAMLSTYLKSSVPLVSKPLALAIALQLISAEILLDAAK